MSHLQKKKQVLMTSHVLVMAAWEFIPPNVPRNEVDDDDDDNEDRGRRIATLICTAPLSRALVANVFVQTRKHLQPAVVDFFLRDKVMPAFRVPVGFVYCVLIDWSRSSNGNPISTVQRISETMPHIQTLDVEELPELDKTEQKQFALAAALPKTLWSLRLVLEKSCFGAGFINQLAESCPFLQRLELDKLDSDACKVIFSSEKNGFPHLRTLSICTKTESSCELYNYAFSSEVVSSPRLESLEFCGYPTWKQHPAPSLKPLERLHSLGSLLANCEWSTVPDFSVLNCCSELNDLLARATFKDDSQQHKLVVDLSSMPCLTSLGVRALFFCRGVHTLVLPPTLRTIGPSFCAISEVQNIDFSLLSADSSLPLSVATEKFLMHAEQIETFSTVPLRGRIGTVVDNFFLYSCSKLRSVDLSGLQGIVEIRDFFLAETAVTELNLSSLGPTCTKIGDFFLYACSALKKVTGCLTSVTSVGKRFLWSANMLEEFDFHGMQALVELGLEGLLDGSSLQVEGTKILQNIVEKNRKALRT